MEKASRGRQEPRRSCMDGQVDGRGGGKGSGPAVSTEQQVAQTRGPAHTFRRKAKYLASHRTRNTIPHSSSPQPSYYKDSTHLAFPGYISVCFIQCQTLFECSVRKGPKRLGNRREWHKALWEFHVLSGEKRWQTLTADSRRQGSFTKVKC